MRRLLVFVALGAALSFGAVAVMTVAAPPAFGTKHKAKPKAKKPVRGSSHPCLEGNWNVTSLTLSTTGITFTGGAGTTVDIMSNGNAFREFHTWCTACGK